MIEVHRPAHRKSARRIKRITTQERQRMVAETAYYLSEQRGFHGGCQTRDWLEAEARIERTYGKATETT